MAYDHVITEFVRMPSTLATEEPELINADVALSGCNTRTVLRLHLDDKRLSI